MNYIDTIYYINLDYRTDRNTEFLKCMEDLNIPSEKIQRIPAIHVPNLGALGCTKSHILALETFIASESNIAMICEDDFLYKNKETFMSDITKFFETGLEFDLIQLSYNTAQYNNCVVYKALDTNYDFIKRAEISITASSYIITKNFAPKLLENFKESAQLHIEYGIRKHEYCHDIYWNVLKPISKWYLIYPPPGYQRNSYSDIENTYVTYNV
jgi:GR25 family glycosyltransferase involved in LPS biosynthesis